jgi:SAM-dependent methyltransferase
MHPETAARLLAINRRFYRQLADPFAQTRLHPQPGFEKLLAYLPPPPLRALDVGCGNGRFGFFLSAHADLAAYSGVDFTPSLLEKARRHLPSAVFHRRDLSRPGRLDDLGRFNLVVCLSTMQHIPGRANRARLLRQMGERLEENGRLFLGNWQFMDSPRQRRKLRDWAEADVDAAQVEPNDYLLTWQRGGFGLRYVSFIDAEETAELAQTAGLHILDQFRSDGKEGDLNLYTILTPAA